MSENNATCRNCGSMIPSQVKFCPNCGTSVQSEINPEKEVYGQQTPPPQYGQNPYGQQTPPPQGQNPYGQQTPPPYGQNQYGQPSYYANQKSKIAAGLLGIFLGHLGIHNFYLGFTNRAITQLILSIIGYCTLLIVIGYILLIITGIWGLVEGIKCLTGSIPADAKGVPLKD